MSIAGGSSFDPWWEFCSELDMHFSSFALCACLSVHLAGGTGTNPEAALSTGVKPTPSSLLIRVLHNPRVTQGRAVLHVI